MKAKDTFFGFIFNFGLSMSAVSISIPIYWLKMAKSRNELICPVVVLALAPIFISFCFLKFFKTINEIPSEKVELFGFSETLNINNSFLPNYLGYFFVSLSVPAGANTAGWWGMSVVFLLLSVFIFSTKARFFNPAFLVLGYDFYLAKTEDGPTIHIITKLDLNDSSDLNSWKLRKLDDYIFFGEETDD